MRKNLTRAVTGLGGGVEFIASDIFTDSAGGFSFDITGLGHETGDIGVFLLSAYDNDISMSVTGWTLIRSYASLYQAEVYVRTMVDSDTTIASAAAEALSTTQGVVAIFRGCSEPTASDIDRYGQISGTPTPPACPVTVTASDMVVGLGVVVNDPFTMLPSSGYTTAESKHYDNGTEEISSIICYLGGQVGTPTPGPMDDAGSYIDDRNSGFTLALKEA